MLKRFKDLIGVVNAPVAQSKAEDVAISITALLVEAACVDEDYTDLEKRLIERALVDEFGVDAKDAPAIREKAEARQAEAVDLYQFTRDAKSLTPELKIALVESLWRIVLSDAKRHSWEDTLLRRVCGLLYISDVDSGAARQRVQRELGL
jgi:uncharacterized tellurite resistance protein B-like protein